MKNTNSNNSRKFRLTSEEKFLILIVLTVLIGLCIRWYGNFVRQNVIENVTLVESSDEHYILSFEGEEHYYTFD